MSLHKSPARELKSREDWETLLQSTDTFLFDCDGEMGNTEEREKSEMQEMGNMEGPYCL